MLKEQTDLEAFSAPLTGEYDINVRAHVLSTSLQNVISSLRALPTCAASVKLP